jgi:PAS domain S-box-containing protein
VDDHPQAIELLEAYLVPLGYEIVKAANGEEALGKLSSNQIDLILLDVIMPGMDGFEVTRRIRQDQKNRLMPIILVTVLKETEDRVKGIEAGCDDFISKPIDKMELFARIRSLLTVKNYNDLMSNYQKELESEVNRRTDELKSTLENLRQEITERKRAEAALKSTEQNLYNSMDKLPIGVRITDNEENTLYLNQAFLKILGYDNIDEVRLMPPVKYYTPESYTDYLRRKEKLFRGERRPDNVEVDIIPKDGGIRHLQLSTKELIWNGKQQYQTIYNDITERKEAEDALHESEEKYRLIVENSTDIIFTLNGQGEFAYLSPSVKKVLGYNQNDLLGIPFRSRVHPDDVHIIDKAEKSHLLDSTQTTINDEYRFHNALGEWRWLVSTGAPMRENNESVFNFVGIARDVTEQKQIEAALKASEQNFRNSIDNSLYGVRIVDAEWHTLFANQVYLDMHGYKTADEADAIKPEELYTPAEYARYRIRRENILRGEPEPDMLQVEIISRDGVVRTLLVSRKKVLWNGQQQYQMLYNDITELKQVEVALRESEEKYRLIAENSRDTIFTINGAEQISYVSPSITSMLGYNPLQLIGTKFISLIHPEDRHIIEEENQRSYQPGYKISADNEYRMRHVSGEWRNMISRGSRVFDAGGNFLYFVGVLRDITEQKQAEKEKQSIEEKAQVASRLAAIGEMAAGIAHEINNPLTGVIGFSQLLLEKQNIPEDIKDDIRVIADGSRRVADIVKRLLTFARQAKPIKTLANLNELIENTLKLRDYVLKTNNIEVITKFDPELPLLTVDPGQMQQVFLNLIVNAEQAMKKSHGRGTLTISTENIANAIRITFQDDGSGIKEEIIGRLFEPFFTTKEVGEGTGLGLSLSRSIVLEHAGRMSVESEFGHGATFILELPLHEPPQLEDATQMRQAKETPTVNKKGRILVVDDEPGVRELLSKVMKEMGHSVDVISDAGSAMEIIDAGTIYDVILADIRMPGMNGVELCSLILRKMPDMKNRIIIITGDVMGTDIKDFLKKNNLPYLAKPFDIKALKEQVQAIVNSAGSVNNPP